MLAKPTPTHQLLPPTPTKLWIKNVSSSANVELLLRSAFAPQLHDNYGAPSTVWTRFEIEADLPGKTRGIEIEVTLINKTSTRLPEAMFFTHNPRPLFGVSPPPPPPPTPPPPPPGTSSVQRGLVPLQPPGGDARMVTVPVTFAVPFSPGVTPVVVATPLQGSTGGGANNNATFLAVVREISSAGFTVSVEVVGEDALWNQESTVSYIAAAPGHMAMLAAAEKNAAAAAAAAPSTPVAAIAGHGDIGAMLNKTKDPATKTISFTFPQASKSTLSPALRGCSTARVGGAGAGAGAGGPPTVSLVLTPQTSRGAANTDVYALSVVDVSCSGATIVATRVCSGTSSCDSFWGQDLQFNYIAFIPPSNPATVANGHAGGAAVPPPTAMFSPAGVQSGSTTVQLDRAASVTITFPTSFPANANPTVLASAALAPSDSGSGQNVALSTVAVDSNGFTVALEMIQPRHPHTAATARGVRSVDSTTSVVVTVFWVADGGGGQGPPPPPPPPPNPTPIPHGTGSLWAMDKLGELVSPLNLVDGGSKGILCSLPLSLSLPPS